VSHGAGLPTECRKRPRRISSWTRPVRLRHARFMWPRSAAAYSKSVDGGNKWTLIEQRHRGEGALCLRLSLDSKGALYLVVARRSDDGRIGDHEDGALYRSENGAESWARLKLPRVSNGPNGLTAILHDPRRSISRRWGRDVRRRESGGGVFVSTDRGGHLARHS